MYKNCAVRAHAKKYKYNMIRKELLKMKKTYEELEMEVIKFEAEDVVTASCTQTLLTENGDVIN